VESEDALDALLDNVKNAGAPQPVLEHSSGGESGYKYKEFLHLQMSCLLQLVRCYCGAQTDLQSGPHLLGSGERSRPP